jgi:3',5'-cyclic AMP phosphodiesterase CpdA
MEALFARAEDFRPDLVMIIGDLMDFHAISRYEKDDLVTWQKEIDESQPILRRIDDMPGKKVVVMGNHDYRCETFASGNPRLKDFSGFDFCRAVNIPNSWDVYADQTHYRIGKTAISDGLVALHGNVKGVSGRDAISGKDVARKMRDRLKDNVIFAHFHAFDHAEPLVRRGEPMWESWGIGWLGGPTASNYVTLPQWQKGFAEAYFDRTTFEVRTHRWRSGSFYIDGRKYG